MRVPAWEYLVAPGEQDDLNVGLLSSGGHFDNNGLHHDRSIREVLDSVGLQHAGEEEGTTQFNEA